MSTNKYKIKPRPPQFVGRSKDRISNKYVIARQVIEMREEGTDDLDIRETLRHEGYIMEDVRKGFVAVDYIQLEDGSEDENEQEP